MFHTDQYLALCSFERRYIFYFLGRNIELKTSKHKFTDKSHQNKRDFEGKKLSGTDFTFFQQNVTRLWPTCRIAFTVFLPRFSRLFGLLSSRILQNNLLDLYLVQIRQYKLSFFAKAVTVGPTLFSVFESSKTR